MERNAPRRRCRRSRLQPEGAAREDVIIYGSGALVSTLLAHNLIDQYRFMIYPLVLGTGKRVRDDTDKKALTLTRVETAATGVAMLVCEPASAN